MGENARILEELTAALGEFFSPQTSNDRKKEIGELGLPVIVLLFRFL